MLSIIKPDKSQEIVLVLALISLISFATGYGGTDYIKGEETETYEIVQEEWKYSQEINFSEVWEGERYWGSSHRIYPIQINTKKLIEQGKVREDCMDIRIASEGKLVGTRVQDRTCNTEETWVYFSNNRNAFGYIFDPVEKVEQIEVFYGHGNASLGNHRVSPYNRNLATNIRPESAIEMYYGTHGGVWVNHDTHLHQNDKSAPSQTWHVDFRNDHGNVGTDNIIIQDQDGNSVTRNSGDYYTIDSGNVPSWVQQGEDITVYFRSNYESHSGERATSNQRSAQWGYPVQFSNPSPARSTSTSPTSTSSPDLSVDIDDPSGGSNTYDVTFYDASDNSVIGSDTVSSGGTATQNWGVASGQTYTWYVEATSSYGTKRSSEWTFDTNSNPTLSNPAPSDGEVIDDKTPRISAEYNDENGDSGSLSFYDSSDDLIDSCSVNPGNRCGVEWSSADHPYNTWYVEATDSRGSSTTGPDWSFVINQHPSSSLVDPNDGSTVYGTSTELKVQTSDPDGDSLDVEFFNNRSNLSSSERLVENVNEGEKASVEIDNLDRGANYNWWVEVSDNWETTKSNSWEFHVNNLPSISEVDPEDGETVTENDVLVEMRVNDQESTNIGDLQVYFYNGNGLLIETTDATSGSFTSLNYPNTEVGESYEWYVKVSDSYGNFTSQIYAFDKTSAGIYRVEPRIDYEYSDIIVSESGSRQLSFYVRNRIDSSKNLVTYLEGVNATFSENNQNVLSYTLESGSERRFLINIDPASLGEKELSIITENQELGVNTTASIPVTSKEFEDVSETSEVPGIGFIQLIMLLLVSAYLYSVRL